MNLEKRIIRLILTAGFLLLSICAGLRHLVPSTTIPFYRFVYVQLLLQGFGLIVLAMILARLDILDKLKK
jgi:hypothetical protein